MPAMLITRCPRKEFHLLSVIVAVFSGTPGSIDGMGSRICQRIILILKYSPFEALKYGHNDLRDEIDSGLP